MKTIDTVKERTVGRKYFNHESLKWYRSDFGFTQEDLAYLIGVPYQQYQKWENGKNMPSVNVLMQLAQLYEIQLEKFFN
ncbi:MAG: helix-turn-helix transcriptional regulator [Sulfolobaceae archaeon]